MSPTELRELALRVRDRAIAMRLRPNLPRDVLSNLWRAGFHLASDLSGCAELTDPRRVLYHIELAELALNEAWACDLARQVVRRAEVSP